MRNATLLTLFAILFAAVGFVMDQSTYVCKVNSWIQISPEGDLRDIEQPDASLFSFIIKDSQLNFVSDDITINTHKIVYISPAPAFRALTQVGVHGLETLYYSKGLFSFIKQTPNATEVINAYCSAI